MWLMSRKLFRVDKLFWEELFFESVDAFQRDRRKGGFLADVITKWESLSAEEKRLLADEEDQLLFGQLKAYVTAMLLADVPLPQVTSFVDDMCLATLMSDTLAEQLSKWAEKIVAREEDRVVDDGTKKV